MKETMLPEIWQMLDHAVSRRTPFTLMQLATVGSDGAPKLRTIVLRRFDEATARLSFVTDRRSLKVKEMLDNPSVSLVAFDGAASVQLRLEGLAAVIEDERRKKAFWNALRNHTHILFQSSLAPGTAIPSPPIETAENCDPNAAYERFCLVDIYLHQVEWLDISSAPHTRCSFKREGKGWTASWIVP